MPEVDLFVLETNAQLTQFYTRGRCRSAEGTDALSVEWPFHRGYMFPPGTHQEVSSASCPGEGMDNGDSAGLDTSGVEPAAVAPELPGTAVAIFTGIGCHRGPVLHPAPERLHLKAWILNSKGS